MSNLEKFDVSKNTKPYRNALAEMMGDLFSVWGKGLSKNIFGVFVTSRQEKSKNQVSKTLSRYEKKLRRMRKI